MGQMESKGYKLPAMFAEEQATKPKVGNLPKARALRPTESRARTSIHRHNTCPRERAWAHRRKHAPPLPKREKTSERQKPCPVQARLPEAPRRLVSIF